MNQSRTALILGCYLPMINIWWSNIPQQKCGYPTGTQKHGSWTTILCSSRNHQNENSCQPVGSLAWHGEL